MALFEQLTLHWKEKSYVIPADRVLGAIAVLEQHITFTEMVHPFALSRFSLSRLACAYASVLRYAGCPASDDEVYSVIFGDKDTMIPRVQETIVTLAMVMMPPAALQAATQDELAAQAVALAKDASRGNRRAASRSSKSSTKRRSVSAAGWRPTSSGG